MTSASALTSFFLFARLAVRMVLVVIAALSIVTLGTFLGVAGYVIYLLVSGPG